ncbi:MAG: hypothetical protein M1833_002498 [Piccolia ochrophora]|nr:MAG: hypothetical protein M1833_002498 [Piccolia ochrophora]
MNHDPESSSRPSSQRDGSTATRTLPSDGSTQRQKEQTAQQRRRTQCLENLVRNLDLVIYAELAALYYFDCSFFSFFFRSIVQLYFLSPKPSFVLDLPKPSPYVGAIFGTNFLCLIMHMVQSAPAAGDATRGYLHGGLLVDFVGQKGPTSKTRLGFLDLLVLLLQVVMLAAHLEHQELRHLSSSSTTSTAADVVGEAVTSTQDYDAEERGVLRSETAHTDDIELQELSSSPAATHQAGRTGGEEDGERDELLADPSESPTEALGDHRFDTEILVASLHLVDTVRSQWWAYENRAVSAPSSTSFRSPGAVARTWAGERFRVRVRVGGHDLGQA